MSKEPFEGRENFVRTLSEPKTAPDHEPSIDVATLMHGRREVTILHAGERYRLRITANNRLILTK